MFILIGYALNGSRTLALGELEVSEGGCWREDLHDSAFRLRPPPFSGVDVERILSTDNPLDVDEVQDDDNEEDESFRGLSTCCELTASEHHSDNGVGSKFRSGFLAELDLKLGSLETAQPSDAAADRTRLRIPACSA